MRETGWIVLTSLIFVGGCWLIVTGWRQPRPSLRTAARRLHRPPTIHDVRDGNDDLVTRLGAVAERSPTVRRWIGSVTALRVIGRPVTTHIGYLIVASIAGLIVPSLVLTLLEVAGLVELSAFVPAGVSLLCAVLVPVVVHSAAVAEADELRIDLRHQLSAFLDMMTMLLAGNAGHEGALQDAADAGDGLLFRQLQRRMREVATTGHTMVNALSVVAHDFDIPELEQVASAAALSASEGAPVARTLAAKCATLRSTLAADDEARARVRNDKVTPPLVGMAVLFMALLIYPALSL